MTTDTLDKFTTSSEAMRIINLEKEDSRRLLKVQSSQLLSLTQGANLCPGSGFSGNNDCGDEIPKGVELCKSCQSIEDAFFVERAREQDRVEAELSRSQYYYLKK